MKKQLKKIVKWEKLILVLLIVLVLGSVFLIRYFSHQPVLYEQESYYHLSQVKTYLEGTVGFFQLNPLEWLILGISQLVNLSLLSNFLFILSPTLALGSIYLYLLTVKNFNLNKHRNFVFLLILILSPAFIFTFTTLSNYAMISFLGVLGIFLVSHKNKWANYFSVPVFLLIPFFETLNSIMILIIVISLYIFSIINSNKKLKSKTLKWEELKGKSSILKVNIIALIIMIFLSNVILGKVWNSMIELNFINNFWQNLVSDFGGLAGISIFVIVLGIIGLYSIWQEKKSYFIYVCLAILIISFYLNNGVIYLLSIIFAYLAACFTYNLIEKNWALKEIKNFTIFLLILGVIFSGLTFVDRIVEYQPEESLIEGLEWLNENYDKSSVFTDSSGSEVSYTLLSLPENEFYVSYVSIFRAFTPLNEQNINLELRNKIDTFLEPENVIPGKEIFYLTYPPLLFPVLENNYVRYVLVDQETKRLFNEKGLLFALRNERFKLIYSDEDFELWEFELEGEED